MQNSMVTSDESTPPFPADLPLTGQDTQHINNHNTDQPELFAGLVSSLAKLMHLRTTPPTITVLQFSNFNSDFEKIERNENILPKAKYITETPCNSNVPKWQNFSVNFGSVITRFILVMKSDGRC